jgi:hypothetical protein
MFGGSTPSVIVPPTLTTSIKLWLKSDAGVVTTGAVTPLVTNWNDQSTFANNASQPLSSYRPAYYFEDLAMNNVPSIDFQAGGDDSMAIPASASLNLSANGFTIYIVANVSSWFSIYSPLLQHSNGSTWTQGWGIMAVPGSKIRFFLNNWNNAANYIELPVPAVNKRTLYKFQWNKASSSFNASYYQGSTGLNNSGSKAFTLSYTNPVEALEIMRGGAGAVSYDTTGKLGEILIYEGVTSAGDDVIVQNYLNQKFNVGDPSI